MTSPEVTNRAGSKVTTPLLMLATGFVSPPIVGLVVRTYLAAIGKPVLPWDWIFGHLGMFLMFFTIWNLPGASVALVAYIRRENGQPMGKDVVGAFIGTMLMMIWIVSQLWLDIEAVVLGAFLVPAFTTVGAIIGGAIGWAAQRLSQRKEKSAISS